MHQKQLIPVAAGGLFQPLDMTTDFRFTVETLTVGTTLGLRYASYEGFAERQVSDD